MSTAVDAKIATYPACYNRHDFHQFAQVQNGWTEDGRRVTAFIPDPMSKGCQQWGPQGEATLHNWNCIGCRHKPKEK